MALAPDQHPPNEGLINGNLYLKNNPNGTVNIYLYIPNGSIGMLLRENVEIFKTTLENLIGSTGIQWDRPAPVEQVDSSAGEMSANVSANKQAATVDTSHKKKG